MGWVYNQVQYSVMSTEVNTVRVLKCIGKHAVGGRKFFLGLHYQSPVGSISLLPLKNVVTLSVGCLGSQQKTPHYYVSMH